MLDLRFLWMLFLQVLHDTEGAILDCPPETPKQTPVKNCNYYCDQNSNGEWRMGYYANGTECQYPYYDNKGICAVLEGHPGCYWHKDEDVQDFLKSNTKTPKATKKPRKKKPKNGTTTTKIPKRKKPKKPKKSSKTTKKSKKTSRHKLSDQPQW
uniref:Basic tail secreted protein n=1 Tax=Rhipicephalus zambeziensis TaxID=60191 RepID=A0A224YB44_9ACAR